MPELALQAQGLAHRHPGQADPLFEDVSLELYGGEKVALLGLNGSGKTTLLELLRGRLEPEAGAVTCSSQPAHLPQDEVLTGGGTVQDALLAPQPGLAALHRELRGQEAGGLPDPLRYAECVAAFHAQGGFDLLARAEATLAGFGFPAATLERPLASTSGGERRLLRLAATFLSDAELTLLDEPTNYLDAEGTQRLITALRASDRTFLIVSHDRWFLDQTVTRVLELERGGLTPYRGNYTTFADTKAALHRQKLRRKEKLESEITKLQEVERTYKIWGARKEKEKSGAPDKGFIGARAARLMKRGILAKERLGARIDDLREAKPWIDKDYGLAFEPVRSPTGTCLSVRGLGHDFGSTVLFDNLSFTLMWGDRVVLAGPNGSGKSTLLKLLLGELEPQRGEVLWGKGTKPGYLPQLWDARLDAVRVVDLFARDDHPRARELLGCLRVKGDAFERPLGDLSEGQKRKALLVRLILQRPNLLILDEPTTHLDYLSVELLERALADYGGTVILVSHDRYLRGRVAEREIAVGREEAGGRSA